MKKGVIFGAVAVVLLGAAGVFAYASQPKQVQKNDAEVAQMSTSEPAEEPAKTDAQSSNTPSEKTVATAGSYRDYSEASFKSTDNTRVLFFHAPWCPQCRSIDEGASDSKVPAGVTVFKTDYDSHQALREKYGVTLQTTFVAVDQNGKLLKKYVAYDQPTFAAVKTNFLDRL